MSDCEERVLTFNGTITALKVIEKTEKTKIIIFNYYTILIDRNEFSDQQSLLFVKYYIDKIPPDFKTGDRVEVSTPAGAFLDSRPELPVYKIEKLPDL